MITDSNELLGQSLGTCTLHSLLGRGGMGAVYLAQQSRPRRTVAVKVLMPGVVLEKRSRAEFLARFRREADAIAALDHVNIMPIYEYGEQEDTAYLVMPYVTGGTLRERLEQHGGTLPLSEIVSIIEQTTSALDSAHAHGIIHRDLKPGNILFHADGRVLLADFGLAKVLRDVTENNRIGPSGALTSIGTIIGTPEYLSPEQGTGNPVDYRTDVYSLGVVLFQMLSGKVPFTGASPIAIAVKHTLEEPPLLLDINPNIPHSVDAVVRKALAKKPAQRFSSAGELARALRAAISGTDTAPAPSVSVVIASYRSSQSTSTPPPTPSKEDNNSVSGGATVDMHEAVTEEASRLKSQSPRVAVATEAASTVVDIPRTPVQEEQDAKKGRLEPLQTQQSVKIKRNSWHSLRMVLLGSFLTLLVVGASTFSSLHIQTVKTQITPTTTTTLTPQASQTATATASTQAFTPPTPLIPAGKALYATDFPGATCDSHKGKWSSRGNVLLKCSPRGTELVNTGTSHLAGIYLDTLPGGQAFPTNYVMQVQFSQASASNGDFGVFFRNQPQQGTYSFLLTPTNRWTANSYDNTSGAEKNIVNLSTRVPLTGVMTIDISVSNDIFTFYLNGTQLGGAQDGNYTNGTLGLAANVGADVFFKNLAIYALPNH